MIDFIQTTCASDSSFRRLLENVLRRELVNKYSYIDYSLIKKAIYSINIAFSVIGGRKWKKELCTCNEDVGLSPCEYCAIYEALKTSALLIEQNDKKSLGIDVYVEDIKVTEDLDSSPNDMELIVSWKIIKNQKIHQMQRVFCILHDDLVKAPENWMFYITEQIKQENKYYISSLMEKIND